MPSHLSDDLARRVRLAHVPPELRAVAQHVPAEIVLHVTVPSGDDVPVALVRLLKLATLGAGMVLGDVAHGAPEVRAACGPREIVLRGEALQRDLFDVVREILAGTLSTSSFLDALAAFASRSAKLAALQTLTSHMLRAEDPDQALYAMLSGVTAGEGLGFHRVALFELDEERGAFVGSKGIGPADEAEAHRIWEAIELEEKGLDAFLTDHRNRSVDARFEQAVRAITLSPTESPADEVQLALDAPSPRKLAQATHPGLVALSPGREFVLAAVRSHGKVRALLFADDRYGDDESIADDRVSFLGFFIDQMALVWHNLSLLRRVEQLARYDALTGVYNRRAFEERLAEEQARCARTKSSFGLLVIDVDRFKEINDREGHAAGDAVLRTLGALMKRDLRTHDVVGRLGGDEFVVLLPEASDEDCTIVARRVISSAAANGISLSIGAASWPLDCPSPGDLLAVADARLYEAKRAGRGRLGLRDSASWSLPTRA